MAAQSLSKEAAEANTQRSVLGDGSLCFRSLRFTEVVSTLAPGFVLVSAFGYNSGVSAPLITAELKSAIPAGGTLTSFVNLSGETGQASAARECWAAWVKENRPNLGFTHILVRSRIMEMAISVLGMIVGGGMIKAHSSVASFTAAVAAHIPGFRQLPTFPDLPPLLADEPARRMG